MIQHLTNLNQIEYHQQRFNPRLLPDLVNAGPVSASILFESRNPLKFVLGMRKKQTADMSWGSKVDMLWLTPEEWEHHYCQLPQDAPRKPSVAQRNAKKPSQDTLDAIAWWDRWNTIAEGKSLIDPDEFEKVRKARDMLDAHPVASRIHAASDKQIVLGGDIPGPCLVPGAQCKVMLDLLPRQTCTDVIEVDGQLIPLNECIADLKQSHLVTEYGMKKAVSSFEYHMKMAWYRRIVEAWEGRPRPHTILIFQNKNAPHDVHVRLIDSADMEYGARLAQTRLDRLSQLNHRDIRPLFDSEVRTLSLSDWMKSDDDDTEEED